MPKRKVRDSQFDFGGGVNQIADPYAAEDNELQASLNLRLLGDGNAFTIRGGTERTNPVAAAAASIRGLFVDAGSGQLLYICNGKLFTSNALPAGQALTDRGGSFSTTVNSTLVSFRNGAADTIYIADGGLLNSWVPSTVTRADNIAGTPSVDTIAVYNNRLFGLLTGGNTLYWSALGDGGTLGNTGAAGGLDIIRTVQSSGLIALAPLGDTLFILHRSAISAFTGWSLDDINISTGSSGVSTEVGCANRDSLAIVGRTAYFVFDGQFWSLDADGTVKNLSSTRLTQLTPTEVAGIKGVTHLPQTQEIVWHATTTNQMVYNYRLDCWYHFQIILQGGATVTAAAFGRATDGTPYAAVGGTDGYGRYLEATATTDDGGGAFSASLTLRRMYMREFIETKALRVAYAESNALVNVPLSVTSNEGTEAVSISFPASGAKRVGKTQIGLKGNYFDVSYSANSSGLLRTKWVGGIILEGYVLGDRI